MDTNYLIEWILKQSGLKVVFFVKYIDHVQTLRIGFASIWKEDILLVSLLKTSCFTNRMSSFHFRAKHIRNVWTWSYTVIIFPTLKGPPRGFFKPKTNAVSRSGDIRKGFLLDCSDKSNKTVRHSTFHSQWFNANL